MESHISIVCVALLFTRFPGIDELVVGGRRDQGLVDQYQVFFLAIPFIVDVNRVLKGLAGGSINVVKLEPSLSEYSIVITPDSYLI